MQGLIVSYLFIVSPRMVEFSYFAPKLWNLPPKKIWDLTVIDEFKRSLKWFLIIIFIYDESQTKLNYLYDSLPFALRYLDERAPHSLLGRFLNNVHVYCVDYFRRKIVPSSVGSEIERVELFSSHPVCWSIFHVLKIVLLARNHYYYYKEVSIKILALSGIFTLNCGHGGDQRSNVFDAFAQMWWNSYSCAFFQ